MTFEQIVSRIEASEKRIQAIETQLEALPGGTAAKTRPAAEDRETPKKDPRHEK